MGMKFNDDALMGIVGAVSILLIALALKFSFITAQMDIVSMYAPAIMMVLYLLVEGEEGCRRCGWAVWSSATLAVTVAIILLYSLF